MCVCVCVCACVRVVCAKLDAPFSYICICIRCSVYMYTKFNVALLQAGLVFCSYPFVLNSQAKANLLQVDANYQMVVCINNPDSLANCLIVGFIFSVFLMRHIGEILLVCFLAVQLVWTIHIWS